MLDFRDPGMREILVLMVPGTLGLAAVQINQFVNTVLATGQGTGAVSWLNYAFRLMYLPIGLFGVSIATAAIPTMAGHAAREDMAGLRGTISSGLRLMLMLNVPATVGLMTLAPAIVGVIFERGAFKTSDTAATAAALTFYAPGLLGYSAVKLASPAFYALRDSRTPVMVSASSVAMNIVLNVTLVHALGYRGLALGTALSALLNALVLLGLLHRRLGGLDERRVFVALLKIVVASLVMSGVVILTQDALARVWPARGFLPRAVHLGAAIGAGILGLAAAAHLLRIAEFKEATRRLVSRIPGLR
jgi:putative peptidoglycan lipid II flippase